MNTMHLLIFSNLSLNASTTHPTTSPCSALLIITPSMSLIPCSLSRLTILHHLPCLSGVTSYNLISHSSSPSHPLSTTRVSPTSFLRPHICHLSFPCTCPVCLLTIFHPVTAHPLSFIILPLPAKRLARPSWHSSATGLVLTPPCSPRTTRTLVWILGSRMHPTLLARRPTRIPESRPTSTLGQQKPSTPIHRDTRPRTTKQRPSKHLPADRTSGHFHQLPSLFSYLFAPSVALGTEWVVVTVHGIVCVVRGWIGEIHRNQ